MPRERKPGKHLVVGGRFINRVNCDHAECAALRRLRAKAFTEGRMDIVNTAEQELAHCAEQEEKS